MEIQWQSKEIWDRAGGNGFPTLQMEKEKKPVVLFQKGYMQTRKSRASPSQPDLCIQFADA